VESKFLGHINKLKYLNHDVADTDKFAEFAKRVYLETVCTNPVGESIDQPLRWETRLEKTRILGMLDITHFGKRQYTRRFVKQMLIVTLGGDIWLDKLVSIDVELIANITELAS
jgi:hypothetical protein